MNFLFVLSIDAYFISGSFLPAALLAAMIITIRLGIFLRDRVLPPEVTLRSDVLDFIALIRRTITITLEV